MKNNLEKEFKPSSWAINNSVTIYVLMALILFLGISSYLNMPREDYPEIKENIVFVSSIYPGNTSEDVEKLITEPLEDKLKSLNNIEKTKEPHNFGSTYYLQYKKSLLDSIQTLIVTAKFDAEDDYKIEGDFGWQFVPNNIEQATNLLLADMMTGDSEYRRHGMKSVDMDIIKYDTKDSFYESTGNIDADILLMDYTIFIMDYVV